MKLNLSIPRRPILIKHKKGIAILTVKHVIYGLIYKNSEEIEYERIKYDNIWTNNGLYKGKKIITPETAIENWVLKTTENNEKYKLSVMKEIVNQRTKQIIVRLKEATNNKQNKGDLLKVNGLEKTIIIDILEKENISNPFEKPLKIPKKPIFIKSPEKFPPLAIFTVNHNIYGFFFNLMAEKLDYDQLNFKNESGENVKTVIKDFINREYGSNEKEKTEEINKIIIENLELSMENDNTGDLDKLKEYDQEYKLINYILRKNDMPPLSNKTNLDIDDLNEMAGTQKALKGNNTITNYSYLLNQLITGLRPTGESRANGKDKMEKVSKSETLNEIAVIIKTKLGLKQELEIKGIDVKGLINDLYIKTEFNTMKKISFEKLYEKILKLLHGTDDLRPNMEINFRRRDLKDILDYIPSSYRNYDILTVGNGLYDFNNGGEFLSPMKIIERFGEPILTHKTTPFNYNPRAEGKKCKEVLRYAFDKYTPNYNPEKIEIKGFHEIGGYSLRSGNPAQKGGFFTGPGRTTKTFATNLLCAIHGDGGKISSLPMKKYTDKFGASALINKQLNSSKETHNDLIKDDSAFKNATGNEGVPFELKGSDYGTIPPIEVPFNLNTGNELPKFENPTDATYRRPLISQFLNKVPRAIKFDVNNNVIEWHKEDLEIVEKLRSKEKELGVRLPIPYVIENYDQKIINDNDEMEWLLYQFLKHEKARTKKNNNIFSNEKTHHEIAKIFNLYSNPVETILKDLIEHNTNDKRDETSGKLIYDVGIEVNELYNEIKRIAKDKNVDIQIIEY